MASVVLTLSLVLAVETRASRAEAEVVAEVVDVFASPAVAAMVTGQLHRGDRVAIRGDEAGGWLAIEPPPGSFGWIEAQAIAETENDQARVVVDRAPVRVGHPEARMPGPLQRTLSQGATVRLLPRPPLTVPGGAQTWRAIAPPADDLRYILAEGIRRPGSEPPDEEDAEVVPAQATTTTPSDEPSRPSDLSPELREAVRTFNASLHRSRQRDRQIARLRQRLTEVARTGDRPYDALGLLQPSAREVEGRRVFALIGPAGRTVAYLDLPPGLEVEPMLARRVGVTGRVRYHEHLRARLIAVRDLEPLDERR